jgi:peptidyl-prolyl cis-trans isomerase SurA
VVDFGALAKKHSEDPQSAPNDGALGWVTPGQLMPEFEQVMASMQPGQVSDPVRTEYGWHLIQLLNRKQTELTAVQQKDFARANLRQAKLEQAQRDWVRELRDAATVEYREPYSAPK